MKSIAIIPARGGSKGLPGKNIKMLDGKPLIGYTIEAAIKSKCFDKIIVTTDSEEIAKISKESGAEIPFIRPSILSTDNADSMDALIHALDFYLEKDERFDFIMKLQPTSPMRTEIEIKDAFELIKEKDGDSVVSVSECKHYPLWANKLSENLSLNNFIRPEIKGKNRQELEKYYELNGLIFLSRVEVLKKTRDWYGSKSYALITDKKKSVDIDDEDDFILAECLIKKLKKEHQS